MKKVSNPERKEWLALLERPTQTIEAIETTVNTIFDDVKRNGNDGIKRYTSIFDGVEIDDLFVSDKEIKEAEQLVSDELKEAIKISITNIEKFHSPQKTPKISVETTAGVEC